MQPVFYYAVKAFFLLNRTQATIDATIIAKQIIRDIMSFVNICCIAESTKIPAKLGSDDMIFVTRLLPITTAAADRSSPAIPLLTEIQIKPL